MGHVAATAGTLESLDQGLPPTTPAVGGREAEKEAFWLALHTLSGQELEVRHGLTAESSVAELYDRVEGALGVPLHTVTLCLGDRALRRDEHPLRLSSLGIAPGASLSAVLSTAAVPEETLAEMQRRLSRLGSTPAPSAESSPRSSARSTASAPFDDSGPSAASASPAASAESDGGPPSAGL